MLGFRYPQMIGSPRLTRIDLQKTSLLWPGLTCRSSAPLFHGYRVMRMQLLERSVPFSHWFNMVPGKLTSAAEM